MLGKQLAVEVDVDQHANRPNQQGSSLVAPHLLKALEQRSPPAAGSEATLTTPRHTEQLQATHTI